MDFLISAGLELKHVKRKGEKPTLGLATSSDRSQGAWQTATQVFHVTSLFSKLPVLKSLSRIITFPLRDF